jgi:amino acid adenylation domain-containing protein/non-ribosomal peptide synthase protein (TIGR01720 family)
VQEHLWFLDRLEPGSSAYNLPGLVYRLRGSLDVAVLRRTLDALARRHEAFRTTFGEVDGRPVQRIDPDGNLPLSLVDLEAAPDREARVGALLSRVASRPFDLARGPLARALLVRLGPTDHLFLLAQHHIVSDGWSVDLLLDELRKVYAAFLEGSPSPLPALALQPADLAAWQRERLQGARFDKLLDWWKERLGGSQSLLELPTDRPRPAVRSGRGAVIRVPLGRWIFREHFASASPFMVLFAAFQALLFRWTGQEDILIGFPASGRERRESEGLVGFFANTLVLRTILGDDPAFADLVTRVREGVLDAVEHQEMPFERLVDELHLERTLSHSPLVQVMFTYRHTAETEIRMPGLELAPVAVETWTSKVDLILGIAESPDGFTGRIEYSSDLFDPSTIHRVGRAFGLLIESALRNPRARLSGLSILDHTERHQLLIEWNDTRRQDPGELIHDLFLEQARRRPDAPALVFEEETITYAELAARAEELAGQLRAQGVGPDVRVGVCLERSVEMIVSLLGVLMAGGAFVPVDPAMPLERRNALFRDSGVEVVVPHPRRADGRRSSHLKPLPENLAYVMFTSGSTGVPKGVAVTHRAVVRLVRDTEYAWFGPDQVFLQLSTTSFDASTFEIWGCLLHGGRLVIAPPGLPSLAEVAELVRRQGVTTLWLTAGLFHSMVEDERLGDFSGLSQLLAGGDALSPPHVRRALAALPNARLINGYGPTESTTFACCHTVMPWETGGSIPIGRPIGNTVAFVVDRWMRPAPIGVPGDLLLGGDGLARGYLSDPALTAERFIPDSLSGARGSRLYRTGDRARLLADGRIEFLGRIDHQLKIRGFRIEPGEIEAALADHPAVAEAAVVAEGREAHSRRLVAFVAPRPGVRVEPREIRDWLKQRLPLYMVPSAVAIVGELPLTPNGKVDRRSLEQRALEVVGAEERTFEPPRSPLERGLAGIWAELLRVESVGRNDNFFDLGGDSLTAIQMVARAARAGIELSLRQLFRHQTVAELAADVEGRSIEFRGEAGWVTGPVPMTPGQVWFFDRIAEHLKAPHQFSNARLVEAREPVPSGVLIEAAAWMLFQHDALRLRVSCRDGVWEQYNAGPEALDDSINEMDLSALSIEDQGAAVSGIVHQLFASRNLEGPLARFVVLRPGRLLYVLHHLVSDAASLSLLREDLETALGQLVRGEPVRLPAKTTSFRAWALRQSELARSEELRGQVNFWLDLARRGGAPLPADFPNGDEGTGEVDEVRADLDEEATRRLLQARRFTDVLLTAVTRAFQRWTGSGAVLLRQSLHGRDPVFDDVDLSRTLGWISTTAPVLLELSGSETPAEALASVAAQIESVPLRGLGYGVLRYMTGDPEIEARMATVVAAPAATFNFVGRYEGESGEPGLLRDLPLGSAPVKLVPRRDPQLRIGAFVSRGPRLAFTWQYGRDFYHRETIERLAKICLEELRTLTG